MVNTLSALKPQQTITEGDTLDAYGLDEPSQTLTATSDNGQTTTIALGNATSDGNSYYMLMNGSETPVYIISDELSREMAVGIYDMCLLPDFPSDEAQLNSVSWAARDTVLNRSHSETSDGDSAAASSSAAEEPTTSWRSDGANVTNSKQVQGIVKQILGLRLDACVDYRPSNDAAALCGFDEPSSVITVNYTGDGGTEETLTLTIGDQVLDGDGRYVRVDYDPTITAGSGQMDMLMKVSVIGWRMPYSPKQPPPHPLWAVAIFRRIW